MRGGQSLVRNQPVARCGVGHPTRPRLDRPPEFYPTVSVSILNLETFVRPGAPILLYMDGTLLTSGVTTTTGVIKPDPAGGGATITWPGATVTYSNSVLYPPGSRHTNLVVFKTDQEISSNPGHFYTLQQRLELDHRVSLSACHQCPAARQPQSAGIRCPNGAKRQWRHEPGQLPGPALQQLAIPPQIAIDRSATSIGPGPELE